MAEETSDQISGQELFDQAIGKETPPPEPVAAEPAAPEPIEDNKGRLRDPFTKRFVGKAQGEAITDEPAVETAPKVEQPKEEKPDHRIPLTELLNEREKRQRAEQERAQYEQSFRRLQQQLDEMQKPKQEFPDFFAEPQSLQAYIDQTLAQRESKWQQEFKAAVANMSLQRAHDKYGDTFMEAYQDVISRPITDPIRQQVINSPDPGQTLVQLYKRERTVALVGDDPQAFVQKALDEALNDPEFLAKAIERAKAQAGSTQATQNKIDLPPSLNKASGSSRHLETGDMSDGSLYAFATQR